MLHLPFSCLFSFYIIKYSYILEWVYMLSNLCSSVDFHIYIREAEAILAANNQHTTIRFTSLINNGFNIFILTFAEISSTMLLSEKWNRSLINNNDVFLFVANRQTQGRGQKQNKWESNTDNIHFTILTKISVQILQKAFIVVVVSVIEAIQQSLDLTTKVEIKWVNDILIQNKKLGGVLIQTDIQNESVYIQIGIGINANSSPIQTSTCILQHLKEKIKCVPSNKMTELIQKLTIRIMGYFKSIQYQGEALFKKYDQRLSMKGEKVVIFDNELKKILKTGVFLGIDSNGFAILQNQKKEKTVASDGRMRKSQ